MEREQEKWNMIYSLYMAGKSRKELAIEFGYSDADKVSCIIRKFGIDPVAKERAERRETVISYRQQGMTIEEIAAETGIKACTVSKICTDEGIGGVIRYNHIGTPHPEFMLSDTELIAKISNYVRIPFQLIEITRDSSKHTYQCKIQFECGHKKIIKDGTLRKWKHISFSIVECDECVKCRRQIEKIHKEAESKDIIKRQWFETHTEQTSLFNFQKCCVCGIEFEGNKRRLYCNDCRLQMRRQASNIKEKKRHKIYSKGDKITLSELYKRDKGICYLCGKICDYSDYVCNGKSIICGNMYPSIDHVKPLSLGGLHTWENVRLAHRICNSIKSDAP